MSPVEARSDVLQRRGNIATTFFSRHPGRDSQGPRLCLLITTFLAVTTTTATFFPFSSELRHQNGRPVFSVTAASTLFLWPSPLPQERHFAWKRCFVKCFDAVLGKVHLPCLRFITVRNVVLWYPLSLPVFVACLHKFCIVIFLAMRGKNVRVSRWYCQA